MTWEKWKSKVCAWQEFTTTSTSRQHLGYFKVLIQRHLKELASPKGQELQGKHNDLVDAHIVLLNYVLDKRMDMEGTSRVIGTTRNHQPRPSQRKTWTQCSNTLPN
eukprot:380091-Ditylum_brightwellii.AAC.1